MPEYDKLHVTLSERLPIVTYTNFFQPQPLTAWISPQVERLTGYPPSAWIEQPGFLEAVLHPDDRAGVLAEIAASRRELRAFSRDYRVVRADAAVMWIHDESVPIIDDAGAPVLIQGYFIDVTARKQVELQLRHLQRTEALGRIAGEVAHDFNNNLTAVRGHVDMLERTLPAESTMRRHMHEIRDATERAGRLTRQLLAYARHETPTLVPLDISKVVEGLKPLLDRVAGARIALLYELGPTAAVVADPCGIEQLVVNLVANARDATAGGGLITIRTSSTVISEAADADRLHVPRGRYVVLTVSDSGAGMDEDLRTRIFEPFFTTKGRDHGTGLGLSIVDKVVREAGGAIDVASAPGRGSSFRVLLPPA